MILLLSILLIGALKITHICPPYANAEEIILVHDKGLPRYAVGRDADLREDKYSRNSFFYVIDLDTRRVLRKYDSTYGIKEGPKQHQGDFKTPVGKYSIYRLYDKPCPSSYGPYSVHTDYPNDFDRRRDNPGNHITIHGGPIRNTAGCLRLLDYRHNWIRYECRAKRYDPSHHVKSIWDLVNSGYTMPGTPYLSFTSLHHSYKGREGERLSSEAVEFYRYLLASHLDNDQVDMLGAEPSLPLPERPTPSPISSFSETLTANASSARGGFYDPTYAPNNVLDGNSSTAWVEGAPGAGIDESVTVLLHANREVSEIRLVNGYDKKTDSGDRWLQNNRVRKLVIEFSNDIILDWFLNDTRAWQKTSFGPVKTRYVKFTIKEVYYGTKFQDDTCISEIRIR